MKTFTLALFTLFNWMAWSAASNQNIHIQLESVQREASTVKIRFSVSNTGTTTIYLEDAPQIFQLEHREGQHWTFVGPSSDLTPSELLKVDPLHTIERIVQLTDPQPSSDGRHVRLVPLRGEFRALLRYFRSREEWLAFQKSPTSHAYHKAVSESFQIASP